MIYIVIGAGGLAGGGWLGWILREYRMRRFLDRLFLDEGA